MTSCFLLRCVAAARLVSLLSRVTNRTLHFAIVVLFPPELARNKESRMSSLCFRVKIMRYFCAIIIIIIKKNNLALYVCSVNYLRVSTGFYLTADACLRSNKDLGLFFFTCQMLRPPCCVFQPPHCVQHHINNFGHARSPLEDTHLPCVYYFGISVSHFSFRGRRLFLFFFLRRCEISDLLKSALALCVSQMYVLNLHACLLNRLIMISPSTGRLGSN